MDVLFYTARGKGVASSIGKWMQSVISPAHFGTCRSLHELESTLRRQSAHCRLAILHINTVEEMDHLLLLQKLLDDIRIILIVPDVNKETLQKGHQLYPRFMTGRNINMNQLAAVIKKNLDYLHIEQMANGCQRRQTNKPLTGKKQP